MNQGFNGWPVPVPGTLILGKLKLTVPQATMRMVISISASNLRVLVNGRTDAGGLNETLILLTFNDDTGANYNGQTIQASSASTSASEQNSATSLQVGRLPGATSAANYGSALEIVVFDYTNTTFYKSVFSNNVHTISTGSGSRRVGNFTGNWASQAVITTVTLTPTSGNFVAGTTMTIYGDS